MDELLNRDPDTQENASVDGQEDAASPKSGIHITNSKNGDKVHIDLSGVHVDSAEGDSVHIGLNGISIRESGHLHFCAEENEEETAAPTPRHFLSDGLWAILCSIAYLLFGCFDVCGGWAFGWLVFLTIPLYSSLQEAISKRDVSKFCYPVFVTFLYLLLGFSFDWWHPAWIVFLTIPVFYSACKSLS